MTRAAETVSPAPRKGERTREGILRVAVNLASVEGLEGLSIGDLAKTLKMSKSGLFAHFGSKLDLQLATIEMARNIFVDHVVRPALAQPAGIPRLWKLCDRWIGHVEEKVFAGGCFFSAASFEFDSRPGPVRTAIVVVMKEWLSTLTRAIDEAKKAGHLKAGVNASSFALEIYSMAVGSQWAFQLLDQKKAPRDARKMILSRIRSQVTPAVRQGEFARLLRFQKSAAL
jgi:AcrR family transcriptional regulator